MLCAGITVTVKIAYWLSVFLEPKPSPWHNFWWDVFCGFVFFYLFSVVVVVVTNWMQLRNSCFQCGVYQEIFR